jgi:hypothetical protein
MEWPSGYVLGIATLMIIGTAAAASGGGNALGVVSLPGLVLVGLAVAWFQLRRGAERARAAGRQRD